MLARHLAFSAQIAGYSVMLCRADKMFKYVNLSVLDGMRDRAMGSYIKTGIAKGYY